MSEKSKKRRGRPSKPVPPAAAIMNAVILFLCKFMPETLAKRVVCMILIALQTPHEEVIELTGKSDRSIRVLKAALRDNDLDSLFVIKPRGVQTTKVAGLENAIFEEIETNNYYNRQQIVNMVREKFGIVMSRTGVSRLLKKKESGG